MVFLVAKSIFRSLEFEFSLKMISYIIPPRDMNFKLTFSAVWETFGSEFGESDSADETKPKRKSKKKKQKNKSTKKKKR